jgi:GTP-binding protein Era
MHTRCGFISILGAPNAGKSTLTNALVGTKVSIVSPKVQTTRQRILGITLYKDAQMILMDTPGIFEAKKRFERAMVRSAYATSQECDVVFVLVDVSKHTEAQCMKESHALLQKINHPHVCLVLNKIDKIEKSKLLEYATIFQRYDFIKKTFMISALKAKGLEDLKDYLYGYMPSGPWLFEEDDISDMPQRLWAAEITREQIFLKLRQELPYDIFVETEKFETFDNGDIKINQIIYVNKASQKGIVLGHHGKQVKNISQKSREQLSYFLEKKVHLFIHVKVKENWAEKASVFQQMNLDFNA